MTYLSRSQLVGSVQLAAEKPLGQAVTLDEVDDRLCLINQAALALDELVVIAGAHAAGGRADAKRQQPDTDTPTPEESYR